MRSLTCAVVALSVLFSPALAKAEARGCWRQPPPQTLEEIAVTAANEQRRKSSPHTRARGAGLALSDPSETQKAAYGAGLLFGWGETGNRPDFSLVTAVGASALIAPFAFLGAEGDRKIADLFSCEAESFHALAERAGSYIDPEVVERIAQRHERGARLLVSIPGSAARPETVWDLGRIAASRHPNAQQYIRRILLAAVDRTTFIKPSSVPVKAGIVRERSVTFRIIGAGEPFLSDAGLPEKEALLPSAEYLIHNGVLFPDEGESYMAVRADATQKDALQLQPRLVAAYDFFLAARSRKTEVFIASPRPHMNIEQPRTAFDMTYLRALFLDAYRQGRLGREWRSSFPDRDRSRYYGP